MKTRADCIVEATRLLTGFRKLKGVVVEVLVDRSFLIAIINISGVDFPQKHVQSSAKITFIFCRHFSAYERYFSIKSERYLST